MPTSAPLPQVSLAPGYTIPRLIKGGWQLAGGHADQQARRRRDGQPAGVRARRGDLAVVGTVRKTQHPGDPAGAGDALRRPRRAGLHA
jgi:hypothetical protein